MKNGMHERKYGTEWYKNGKLHREDGPAFEGADGTKHWYLNGELHRLDGPAFEDADGYKEWWVNGKWHSFDSWLKELDVPAEDKLILTLKWA